MIKYLDNASTTKVDPRVLDEMLPYFTDYYGNASSNHEYGTKSRKAIEKARCQVANIVNAEPEEIIFTSGSTESINLAIKGYSEANADKGSHIITVKTEHKAVLATCEYLETIGYEITYLDVDKNGLVDLKQLEENVNEQTILIAVMYANNETGVIQPIEEIGEIAANNNLVFFCDATQAVGKVEINLAEQKIDMLCFSGHKINGPKGIGVLYMREGVELIPLIHGGGQENGIRSGTYNTPLIVGLGKACNLISKEIKQNIEQLFLERNKIANYYETNEIGQVNFKDVKVVPHILSITLNNYEAEEYLMLKHKEFVASTGSACNAEVVEPSHVLKAMNLHNSKNIIRISI